MKLPISTPAGWLMALLSAAALAGCSSGGDDGPGAPPPPPPPPPVPGTVSLALAETSADEDAGGIAFTVSRSGGSDGAIDVEVRIAGGTADPVDDVRLVDNVLAFADGDTAVKTGELLIADDSEEETDETVELELVVLSGGAALGASTTMLTIADNDGTPPPPVEPGFSLNDTGVTVCVDGLGVEFACDAPQVADYPGQDGTDGRDVNEPADADGRAGFVFSRLDAAGTTLTDPAPDYATTPWDCVMDHVTGLTWEVKTRDDGLRDVDNTYFWRRPQSGEPPSESGPASCSPLVECGVRDYVSAVNAAGLCGLNNWRVPSRHELLSIIDFGTPSSIAVDQAYFPNTAPGPYWTESRIRVTGDIAHVEFDEGLSLRVQPSTPLRIRLVSGGY